MLPDFNRLKVFYHIYKNMGVAAAARELNITQSAVSQNLGNLETEMKTRLFTRVHKRLVPTPAGEKLYNILNPFVADLENGIRDIHHAQKGPFGLLRIGAPVGFGENYLPAVFASFIKLYPDISFHLELGHPTHLLPPVGDGRLDFVFTDIFTDQLSKGLAAFSVIPIINEELVLACSKSYYDENIRGYADVDHLLDCRYVAYRKHAPAIGNWFRRHFNKHSVKPAVALTAESVRAVINGIRQNIGLGIVPSHFITGEIRSGEMLVIRTGKKEMINRISLVRLQDKVPSLSEKMFLEHFMSEIGNYMPGPGLEIKS